MAMPNTVTRKQLAELLQLSTRHVSRMNAAGQLPKPMEFGRAHRWYSEEITRWINAGAPPREEWEALKQEANGLAVAG